MSVKMDLILLLFICVSVNLVHSQIMNEINVTDTKITYEKTLNPNAFLIIKVLDLPVNNFEKNCEASCKSIDTTVEKSEINFACMVLECDDDRKRQCIDASSRTNVTESFNGNWMCLFRIQHSQNWTLKNYTFKFNVQDPSSKESTKMPPGAASGEPPGFPWVWIWVPIGILAVLIIIVQALCIVRIWLKAKARTELANLRANQARESSDNNSVRYTTMPTQVKMEQKNLPRDSVIYEALENIPSIITKPAPPPIDTLPRSGKAGSPMPIDKPMERSRKASVARMPPGSAPRVKKDDNISISSIDRIKNRAPLPIPNDEPIEYEVMNPTSPVHKRPPVALKVKTRLPPGMPPQVVPNFSGGVNQGPVLPSMIAAAQLKPVNKTSQWNQPQRKPTMESKPYAPKNTAQCGFNPVPSMNRSGPPVLSKPPRPLPVQSIPTPDKYTESSDEEEWTYEPLPHYDGYNGSNIYDNIPR